MASRATAERRVAAEGAPLHPGSPWPLGASVTLRGVNFSVVAPQATRVELLLFSHGEASEPQRVVELDQSNRSGDHWHVEVEGVGLGSCYGYRVYGPLQAGGHSFNPSKVLLDPCARAIAGWSGYRREAAVGAVPNTGCCLKGVVTEREQFDFDAAPRPRHSWQRSVIYELHVGGFTQGAGCPVPSERRGTLLGLIDTLPHLQELGVTAIELLPVMAFDPADAPAGRQNHWGYSPISWMAPHQGYLVGDDPLTARDQVRELVSACHQAGIEVILDVVYNHTSEGNQQGPTLSWRGLGDQLYYQQGHHGEYLDVSGCGNTIAANRPLVRRLILESLRCWAVELGVDGFRFDLGIALSRGDQLQPLDAPPLFEAMEADPQLADLKLISEPWDCGGLYKLADFPALRVATWNGRFRDDVRRFWKGDQGTAWALGLRLSGSPDLYEPKPPHPGQCITFLTAHDGFTLADLVSFNGKHNLANGEDNRDGDNHNNSWNHGVEGPSSDHAVTALRERQLRNLLATLLLAPGVPMLLMGDEVRRSQGGNNNTWCQNNPLGWMHWQPNADDLALRTYLRRLLNLRTTLKQVLNPESPLPVRPQRRSDDEHALWRQWHGVEINRPDWAEWSHTLAWSVNERVQGPLLWCGLNAYSRAVHFELPVCPSGWVRVIDTALPAGDDLPRRPQPWKPTGAPLESRSLMLLVAQRLLDGVEL
ncbi:glycogen-debranching protein [Cyanobium sp. ATX 6A2]|uniref:glycogen debranching protein n=1 Tax=Cyanobium sp. ATX 6A2 TaxID=2823700 RepID=UPI0020CC1402|nr:isoamylase [Cyanobium sp. ATX 6A2]MCP9886792.1 glycogen-debranching protein [Cyanobium sp. ATX 6A2]